MNKRTALLLILLFPLLLSAQKSKVWNKPLYDAYPYHFGFAFYLGTLDFSVDHSALFDDPDNTVYSVEGRPGATGGVSMVGNLRLNQNFDLRFTPGMIFGQRNLDYRYLKITSFDTAIVDHTMKLETTLLQFPLSIKYRAIRENNYRPYFVFGVNYVIDLASRKKIKEEEKPKIRLHQHDVMLEAGFGVDNYLPFFKFSAELRFSYGLMNLVKYDNTDFTSKTFDRLGSKMVSLIIFFE